MPNLKHTEFKNKKEIQEWAISFIEKNEDAYNLSMGLLVAAYLGDEPAYKKAKEKMQTAMDKENFPAWAKVDESFDRFSIWLNGRMLVAAKAFGDDDAMIRKNFRLQIDLSAQNKNEQNNSLGLAFVTWGWSYYAMGLEGQQSINANKQAITGSLALTGSNQIWGWVMTAQAAGHAKDKVGYQAAIQGLGLDQPNGIESLYTHFDAADYRAWGFAGLRAAAHDMDDQVLFDALKESTERAIIESPAEKEADKMLATVYNELACVKPYKSLNNSHQ